MIIKIQIKKWALANIKILEKNLLSMITSVISSTLELTVYAF